ncbi:anti-sigma factor family protein [Streptomyces sp. 6N223]|uniref:anti-sigma factor family protein n=1 Tax=Streptomyces sp. 6N223 TaxID=3457412 RepID=UPI003FD24351
MTSAAEAGPADQHLGESLAALIDGELSHDSRDRVLAHLATCPSCKDEADAQRRLKSVFATSPLPAPPAGLLARLQGLPATNGEPDPPGSSRRDEPRDREEPPGPKPGSLPGGRRGASWLGPPIIGGVRGFRIHEPGAAGRTHRGHRLAFAAAGAVSLAAFAIGGAMTSPGATGAGAASGGSTVAAGGGASPASVVRATSNRPEEDTARRSAVGSVAASDTSAWPPGASDPAGLAEQLFPALGPILAAGPDEGSTTSVPAPMLISLAPVGGLGIVGATDAP